jgi:DNA-binding winged helix-turn-helix (wHTH) protein
VAFGDCVLDSGTRQLFAGGKEVHLQPKAYQVLELLLETRPKAVSKHDIHERLWPGTFVSDGTLTSLVAELRDAIGDDAHEPRFVRTVHRFGYAFSGVAHEVRDRLPVLPAPGCVYWLLRGRRRIPLEPGESILGRDAGAGVYLDDPSVSRRHARILISADGATLEDLGSKNGTFLGERKIDLPEPLSDNDTLRIGSVALTIRIFPVSESTETGVKGAG